MKTAKEFYNETEYPKQFTKLTSTGISNDFENVFEFAELYAKALLEEAAEKIDNDIESPVDQWHDAFNAGMQGARKIVFSLIPKEQ